jgi:hypothetical protein
MAPCASPPASFELVDALRGDGVLALGRDQFRAVDLEQRLAAADRLAGGIDVQALDVALELGGDRVGAAFVDLDPAAGAHARSSSCSLAASPP